MPSPMMSKYCPIEILGVYNAVGRGDFLSTRSLFPLHTVNVPMGRGFFPLYLQNCISRALGLHLCGILRLFLTSRNARGKSAVHHLWAKVAKKSGVFTLFPSPLARFTGLQSHGAEKQEIWQPTHLPIYQKHLHWALKSVKLTTGQWNSSKSHLLRTFTLYLLWGEEVGKGPSVSSVGLQHCPDVLYLKYLQWKRWDKKTRHRSSGERDDVFCILNAMWKSGRNGKWRRQSWGSEQLIPGQGSPWRQRPLRACDLSLFLERE